MKIIVQIPCFNEEKTLPSVLAALPKEALGHRIETLVIDDGSSDETAEVAASSGADYLLKLPHHCGLATAFQSGIVACLELGADIIVNTDGDGQYDPKDLDSLIEPIIDGKADMVLGERDISSLDAFSSTKKTITWLANHILSAMLNLKVRDCRSGFRSFHRRSAKKLSLQSNYTHTIETLFQIRFHGGRIERVPVKTLPPTRPSRLFSHLSTDLLQAGGSVLQSCLRFRPLFFSATLAVASILPSLIVLSGFIPISAENQAIIVLTSLTTSTFLVLCGFILQQLLPLQSRSLASRTFRGQLTSLRYNPT